MDPPANARLDSTPAHVSIMYDSNIAESGTSLALLDSTGTAAPVQPDTTSGRQSSVQPMSDLAPGPYTVAWTSLSADDGHTAQGFYTFVVNGGEIGIVDGQAQSQAPAADLMATLTVTSAPDGSSLDASRSFDATGAVGAAAAGGVCAGAVCTSAPGRGALGERYA